MNLLLRLIRNEWEKIVHQWRLLIAIAFFTLLVVAVGFSGVKGPTQGGTAANTAWVFLTGGFTILFIPLTVCMISGDVVSGELSAGTIKMLLTRPVDRWKIWLSKFFAATAACWALMLYFIIIVYVMLGFKLGFGKWSDAIPLNRHPLYQNAWAQTWRVVAVESLSIVALVGFVLLVSTAARTGVAGISISFGAIVIGFILDEAAQSHAWLRYILFPHLEATQHLIGQFPVPGCPLAFSLKVLTGWLFVSVAVGLWLFQRRDILS